MICRLYPVVRGLVKVSVYALGLYAEEKEAAARLQGEAKGGCPVCAACLSSCIVE